MDQRLSLITLGVGDVSRAQAFYEALGWHLDGGVDDEADHVAFFQTPGVHRCPMGPGETRHRQRRHRQRRLGRRDPRGRRRVSRGVLPPDD